VTHVRKNARSTVFVLHVSANNSQSVNIVLQIQEKHPVMLGVFLFESTAIIIYTYIIMAVARDFYLSNSCCGWRSRGAVLLESFVSGLNGAFVRYVL